MHGGTGIGGGADTENVPESPPWRVAESGAPLRSPQPQGAPWNGPIQLGAKVAEHMVQVAYNAQHKIPWHWPVPAYLVTKGIGAGIFMIFSLGLGLDWFEFESLTVTVAGFLSLLFIAATTGLLVYDLEKPERFLTIMTRPQMRSWLTRGAFILVAYSALAGIWWLLEAGAHFEILSADVAEAIRPVALWLGFPLAVGVATYTAFLFAQAEGRDLWQSPLLPVHLLVQSFLAGSGALLLVVLFLPEMDGGMADVALTTFAVALILDLFVTLVGEFGIPHASEVAARAAHEISEGRYGNHFWYGSVGLGHIVPLALVIIALTVTAQPIVGALAGLCAIVGLYVYEYIFVMAPQEIPNS